MVIWGASGWGAGEAGGGFGVGTFGEKGISEVVNKEKSPTSGPLEGEKGISGVVNEEEGSTREVSRRERYEPWTERL